MAARRRPATGSVVAYIRVSTDEQANSGAGLDAQRHAINAEAQRRGWTIVAEYADEGISGAKGLSQRPGLAAAVTAVENTEAEGILAAKLDRISRSVADMAALMDRAHRNGWQLTTCDLAVDTATPAGEAAAGMMAVFSQLERRLIGQRTREALAVKRAQGIRLGRPATLNADVVARIVNERNNGVGVRAIAAALNRDNVPTARGGAQWYPSTVQRVLEGQDAAQLRSA